MLHTTELPENWIAIHDGDPTDGDVILRQLDGNDNTIGDDIVVPFNVIFSLIVKHVRDVKISKIEEATDSDVLGI